VKKAQLSIETMIIYGLVILVALSVIGALIYFNILDLSNYLPNQCNIGGTGDLKCEEMSLKSDGNFQLGIRNTGSRGIELLEVILVDEEGMFFGTLAAVSATIGGTPVSGTNTLGPGQMALVSISGSAPNLEGRVMNAKLFTTYRLTNGVVDQEASGSIRIKAV
jgi:hypothetical protein